MVFSASDLVAVIASLTTMLSVFATIFIAIINNRYQYRIEKMRMHTKHRIEVIDQYIEACGTVIENPRTRAQIDFAKIQTAIFLYVPHQYWKDIEKLHTKLDEGNREESLAQLATVSKRLFEYMEYERKH